MNHPTLKLSRIIVILLVCGLGQAFSAKAVEDYFNEASFKYISGRLQEAKLEVEEALRIYPNDPKIQALASQLKNLQDQKQPSQGGQGSSQDQDSKDEKQEDQKDQKNENENKDSEQNKQDSLEQQKKNQAQESQDKKEEKTPQDTSASPNENASDSSGQDESEKAAGGKPQEGKLSPEEAKRLLDALKDQEKEQQRKLRQQGKSMGGVKEDW